MSFRHLFRLMLLCFCSLNSGCLDVPQSPPSIGYSDGAVEGSDVPTPPRSGPNSDSGLTRQVDAHTTTHDSGILFSDAALDAARTPPPDAALDARLSSDAQLADAALSPDASPAPPCTPTAKRCDGVDNDCDGIIDDGGSRQGVCACERGSVRNALYCARPVVWSDARDACAALGGRLAVIRDAQLMGAIANDMLWRGTLMGAPTRQGWIGLHDPTGTGRFEWVTGAPLDYEAWGPNQPDNWRGNERCVTMSLIDGLGWNDFGCTRDSPFVCTDLPD